MPITTVARSHPYKDRSGAIAQDNVSQEVSPARTRSYLIFQNVSDTTMGIGIGAAATLDSPSILIVAGGSWEPLVPPDQAISVICATNGKKFTAKEI
jgi:hypothetical protein